MDGNLKKEESPDDNQWIRLHKKIVYLEILLLVISFLCLFSLVLNAVNFYLFSQG